MSLPVSPQIIMPFNATLQSDAAQYVILLRILLKS